MTNRVKYKKAPLVEVIFQLRFPTILSINAYQPVDFQTRIRRMFPYYSEQLEKSQDVVLNPAMQSIAMGKSCENKNYAFITPDELTKVNLTPSFIAISTMNYDQWEQFEELSINVIEAFEKVYEPAFYNRVGLRYTNVITRSNLGLERTRWSELMKPDVLGMMTPEREAGVQSYASNLVYATETDGVLCAAHIELVHVDNQPELSLLMDCDYYTVGVTKNEQVRVVAGLLHNASSSFMQNAISEKLSLAMGPEEIN